MITYLNCLITGLLGIALVFDKDASIAKMTFGAALYFVALFWAAIHSINGALI